MPDNPTPELLAALSEFQRTTLSAFKDKEGYGYKYATETSVNETIQPAKAQGFVHTFSCKGLRASEPGAPGVTEVTLRLFHAPSGGFLTSSILVDDYDPAVGKTPKHQQRGGGITYAKRYLLIAMFGLACDENEGETVHAPAEVVAKKPSSKPPAITPKQQADFSKQRGLFSEKIKALHAADPGTYDLWAAQLLAKFDKNSAHPISAAKPTPNNLNCPEHFAFCDEFIAQLKLASSNGKS